MKKIFLSLTLILVALSSAFSQNTDKKWAIFVGAHATDFTSKYGMFDGYFDVDDWSITPPLSRLVIARSLSPLFVADFTTNFGSIDTKDQENPIGQRLLIEDGFFINAGLGLRLKLLANGYIGKEDGIFDPYLRAGVAYQYFNYNETVNPIVAPNGSEIGEDGNLSTQLGLGFNLWITETFGLQVASDFNWIPDSAGTETLNFFQHSLGVGFRFGKPSDKDSDGLLDKEDNCPEEAGPVENIGCPWPDTDGDTVLDKDDSCPDVPGDVENMGCPWGDLDGDGVTDNLDECPEEVGTIENNGCPEFVDSDGDGIADDSDLCPSEAGSTENGGCPDLTKTIEDLEAVLFKLNSSEIQDSSRTALNNVANTLKQNPNSYWIIEGHTDTTGSLALNKRLSLERAESVKSDLVSRGVEENRLKTVGYGPDIPIRPNTTDEGRRMNRRVEFKYSDSIFNVKAIKVTEKKAARELNRLSKKIYFETGSNKLKSSSTESLNIIAEYLKASNSRWEIGGHTDSQGSDALNLTLSNNRATAVLNYLVNRGVPASNLSAVGYGETSPISYNNTVDGRADNRRIEFKMIEDGVGDNGVGENLQASAPVLVNELVEESSEFVEETQASVDAITDENAEEQLNVLAKMIYFETGSFKLRPVSTNTLDTIAEYLKTSNFRWEIGSHTDIIGEDAENLSLSINRSGNIMDYLINKGVPAMKLTAVGFGERMPLEQNSSPKNSRTEFKKLDY